MRYLIFDAYTNYEVSRKVNDLEDTNLPLDVGYPIYVLDFEGPNSLYIQRFFGASLENIDVPNTFEEFETDIPKAVLNTFLTIRLTLGD